MRAGSKVIPTVRLFSILLSFLLFSSFHFNEGEHLGVKTVVIDAGHGGKDGGCPGGIMHEKEIALAIALKTGHYIRDNLKDVKVIFTRETDVFIKLSERARIANRNKADLFICIHVNSSVSPKSLGSETYVMGLAKSEANMAAAKRENASILLEENYQEAYLDFDPNSPESYIALTLRQSAFLDQSLDFAAKVQKQFRERVGRHDRGVKQAPFLVLHQTTMPSVLIETGFLTNKEEEKFLVSEVGQDYMASAIYRAFKEYKFEIEKKLEASFDEARRIREEKEGGRNEVVAGLRFKVQIATSSTKIDIYPDNFKGLESVEIYEAGGLYRYTFGDVSSPEEAYNLQKEVRERGYKDAFVVAFLDGKRISVGEATKLIKKAL